jgi:hypothetical protein
MTHSASRIALLLGFVSVSLPACASSTTALDTGLSSDGGPICGAIPAVGCPCSPDGMIVCTTIEHPELICSSGAWRFIADACGERDAGRDAAMEDASMSVDAGVDAFTPTDAATAPDVGPRGTGTFGGTCTTGADCASGVCWDFSDSDPLCFGRGCSMTCTTDAECRSAAGAAGAPTPSGATCTPSTGTCDLSATGLVPLACA